MTQTTHVPLQQLPALESARPKHSSPSGADPIEQAGGETDRIPRDISSVPPKASPGTPTPLPRMLVLRLKLGCVSPQILNSFRPGTISLTSPVSLSMPGPLLAQ